MKKLMIAAACAAVGLGAFAENTPEVYNMTITVKTTTCKAAQGKNICDDDYSTFRVKATQKIEGVIWGCDCPTIAEPVAFTSFDAFGTPDACHGYVFWDNSVKTKNPYETAEFVWSDAAGIFENFLQCINPKCTDVEGVWTLTLKNADDEYLVLLQGAGIGSAKWASKYNAAYIASMSGNVTGWAFPGSLTYGCAACGETYEGCAAWAFCTECEERGDDYPSAAYGTWNLKFNKGSAVKYGKGVDRTAILSAVKFPAAVEAYLIAKDAEEPKDCTAEKLVWDAAKAKTQKATEELSVAEATVAQVTDDQLKTDLILAKQATQYSQTNLTAFAAVEKMYGITQKTWTDKGGFPLVTDTFGPNQELTLATLNARYYSIANTGVTNVYNTAKVNLQKAEDAVSTNKYEILIKNADGSQVFNGPVYGSKAAAEKIALNYEPSYKRTIEVKAYTLDRSSKLYPWVINPARTVDTTDLTKAWIDGNSAKWASDDAAALVKATTEFNTAKENLATAQAALIPCYTDRAAAYDAQVEAQNRWDNRKVLQAAAAENVADCKDALEAAETAEAIAKAAYDKCMED